MISEIFLGKTCFELHMVRCSCDPFNEDLSFETSDLGCSGSRGIMITIWDKSYALLFSSL